MNILIKFKAFLLLLFRQNLLPALLFFLVIHSISAQNKIINREHLLMDFGWRFAFGHPFKTDKDFNNGTGYFSYFAKAGFGDGPADPKFDDRAWRTLDLPHDWAVEQELSEKASFSHGFKAIGRNFPERCIGWYRKSFSIPSQDSGRSISIEFESIFRNSIVWLNGHYLGNEPSGYNSITYDITDYLNYGGTNVIAVRADASMEEGWFYEGAGIPAHVWLTKTNPLHVTKDGTFITTTLDNTMAKVNVRATIINEGKSGKVYSVVQTILDNQGRTVASNRQDNLKLLPLQFQEVSSDLTVENPELWNLDSPVLYTIYTSLSSSGVEIDQYKTTFGIRTIKFDAEKGFFLNGKNIKLKGTNNHLDHAGVGTAIPDQLYYYRLKCLKKMGSNAYRCSHNPPPPALLDACDRLGILVLDENRLMGTNDQMKKGLKGMIVRDRNHPSIISWSIGNEEWAIENNNIGARIATTMQAYAKSLDSTRTVTAGISGGFKSGISDVIEVMGYNYMGNGDIEAHHTRFPDQPSMGTEEGSTFATRGIYMTDLKKHYNAAYDQKPRPSFYSIEEGWNFYFTRPYLAGMFIWTGFDYRGEATPYEWPSVTSYFGMMDLCGFPKDNYYYLKSWWLPAEPMLHLLPHWNWKGQEGKEIEVWAYSNCEEVELFLNKKSLGKKIMKENAHAEWKVKFEPGTLEAIGYKNNKKILTDIVRTTDNASSVQLTSDKTSVNADREDVSVITVSALDKNNRSVPTAENEITFELSGPGKILGVGNGDPTSLEIEKFTPEIIISEIGMVKEKPLENMESGLKFLSETDTTTWKQAFKSRDYSNLAPVYIHRSYFELPETFAAGEVTFFYKSIGREQSIYINGNELGKNLKENEQGNIFKLDHSILHSGKNIIDIIATPIPKKNTWDNVNTYIGCVQLVTPSESWKRKLFNGLAQVIIQTTEDAGEITLKASSIGLKSAILRIPSTKVTRRPYVE